MLTFEITGARHFILKNQTKMLNNEIRSTIADAPISMLQTALSSADLRQRFSFCDKGAMFHSYDGVYECDPSTDCIWHQCLHRTLRVRCL